jgi:hypothetical protein
MNIVLKKIREYNKCSIDEDMRLCVGCVARLDGIRLEMTTLERERVGVAPIVEKMVGNSLRWFVHVERRAVDYAVRRVHRMEDIQFTRGRGRPRKTIRETINKDLEINELDPTMVHDKSLWRNFIHVPDPT